MGADIRDAVVWILEDLGNMNDILSMTIDNALNNSTAFDELGKYYAELIRVRCASYVLNL